MRLHILMVAFVQVLVCSVAYGDTEVPTTLDSLGDKESIERFLDENGIPNIYDRCRTTATESDFKVGQKEECPLEGQACFYNDPADPKYDPDGDGKKQKTTDLCIIGVRGNECEDGQCCDFAKKLGDGSPDTASCQCITDSKGGCKDPAHCAECACDAEARGESADVCKKMVLCALHNRAEAHRQNAGGSGKASDYYCNVVLYQDPGSDVPQISSKKCICDRSFGRGDTRGTNPKSGKSDYNQYYCDCCDAKKKNPGKPFNKQCAELLNNLDCSGAGYSEANSFVANGLANPRNCTSVAIPGGTACGHKFFKCSYNPR